MLKKRLADPGLKAGLNLRGKLEAIILFTLYLSVFGLSIQFLPFVHHHIEDFRVAKQLFVKIGMSLIIGSGFYYGIRIRSKNPFFLFLLGYLVVHGFLIFPIKIGIGEMQFDSFWRDQALFEIGLIAIFYLIISNMPWGLKTLDRIFKHLHTITAILVIYLFCQNLGVDQWQDIIPLNGTTPTQPHLTTTLTNSTFSAAFIAMMLPVIVYLKRWWTLGASCLALLLCQSDMAYIAVLAGGLAFLLCRYRQYVKLFQGVLFAGFTAVVLFIQDLWPWMSAHSSGRFGVWQGMLVDLKAHAITGYGLNAYRWVYTLTHKTDFLQAHNEYLEILYNTGIIGVGLFIFSLIHLIKGGFSLTIKSGRHTTLFCCIVISCVLAAGTFVWQIQPLQYISILMLGLLTSEINKEKEL